MLICDLTSQNLLVNICINQNVNLRFKKKLVNTSLGLQSWAKIKEEKEDAH
jgi:hypothetical protein